jgi:hypothetical protein
MIMTNKDELKAKLAKLNSQLEGLGLSGVKLKPGKGYDWAVTIAEDRLEDAQANIKASQGISVHCSFDPGNRSTILYNGEDFAVFRSTYVPMPGSNSPDVEDKNSSIVTLISSSAEESSRKNYRYYFGKGATKEPNYTVVFEGELKKIEISLLSLLPCVAALYPNTPEIEMTLNVNVTDPHRDLPNLKRQLLGVTEFEVDGFVYRLNVTQVKAFTEGVGVWHLAKSQGFISGDELAYTGVINLGGSTAQAILIDSDGNVLPKSSFLDDKLGTYELALRIKRLLLSEEKGQNIRLDHLMDALEKGTYLVGLTDFSSIVQSVIDDWFSDLKSKILDAWNPKSDLITSFFITGGSAHLIRERVENSGYWLVTEDLILDNVKGIYAL